MLGRVEAEPLLAMLGELAARPRLRVAPRRSLAALASLDSACARWGAGFAFRESVARAEDNMLRIYDVMVRVLEGLRDVLPQIGRRDRNLEDQLRRAATSVLLNIAEGSGSRGGNRTLRYSTALGSARESQACLQAASALGYVPSVAPAVNDGLREIVGTLIKLTR